MGKVAGGRRELNGSGRKVEAEQVEDREGRRRRQERGREGRRRQLAG